MKRLVISALLVLGAGLSLAVCGGGRASHAPDTRVALLAVAPGTQLTRTAPPSLHHGSLPALGVTQRVVSRGAALSVTVRTVIDPLAGSGALLTPGTRAVGVVVQIRNAGPDIYDSSATGDIAVVASSGTAMPVLAKHGVCKTPLEDFDRYISAGEDRVGCVVFAVQNSATVTAVRFSPHAQSAGRLVWAG